MGSDDYGVDTAAIDSACSEPPTDADGATESVCSDEAVTFVFRTDGRPSYICQDHVDMLFRFGDDDLFDGGKPTAVRCKRCLKLTPKARVNFDKICDDCQL